MNDNRPLIQLSSRDALDFLIVVVAFIVSAVIAIGVLLLPILWIWSRLQ